MSDVLTPAELSMASVLSLMPQSAASTPALSHSKIGALPTTLQRSSAPGDPDRVIGAVADRFISLGGSAYIGSNATKEMRSAGALRIAFMISCGVAFALAKPRMACACPDSTISFALRE